MNFKLEVIIIPVSDVNRAKKFLLPRIGTGSHEFSPLPLLGPRLWSPPGLSKTCEN